MGATFYNYAASSMKSASNTTRIFLQEQLSFQDERQPELNQSIDTQRLGAVALI